MSKLTSDIDVGMITPAPAKSSGSRAKLFTGFFVVIALAGGGYYAYDTLYASKHAITDNAYVGADIAPITPLIPAPVVDVLVSDTQAVKKGDVLVRLDDTDAKLQLAMAQASYEGVIRKVKAYLGNDRSLKAQIAARQADQERAAAQIISAQADYDKTRVDLDRRKTLVDKGSVSGDELTTVQTAFRVAEANLAAARAALEMAVAARESAEGGREANAALIEGVSVENNPEVLAAKASRDQAAVNVERAVIRAPIDGVIAKRQVQVGQRVQPGMTLMNIVPLTDVYVDANYKEGQLTKVRVGQAVELTSDLYGSNVVYRGHITGFSGGTGSAFSLVPAQNATGNWIKVVQRLPVRIALDPAELKDHPLAVGLSMSADIHLAD
jgi:membrane fusion protein (multidrug efflux system)